MSRGNKLAKPQHSANDVRRLSPSQVRAAVERLARKELGVSGAEALQRLDRGDFDGTILEAELSMLRHLLGRQSEYPAAAE